MKRSSAEAALKKMPAEFHIDELLEKLMLIEQVEKGLGELDAGKGVDHKKVMAAAKRKWRK